ncbi:MAG: hypothetical protein JW990_21530 [Thermoleophilia bacterium]|nr:hypothetical protein [Thermoleophilia bacterium]
MRHASNVTVRSSLCVVVPACLTALAVLIALTVAACGEQPDVASGAAADIEPATTATGAAPATTAGAPPSVTSTLRDTGITTTSTPPASVPALASGITPEQALELVAAQSHLAPEDWSLRSCRNLGDWAVADLYTSVLAEQMDERGVAAVFEKKDGAWVQAGWVSVSDAPHQQMNELTSMGAPEHVWAYFGLDPASVSTGEAYPPEQMPDDFGFTAAYGVLSRNEIDTFASTFTKDLGPQEARVTTGLRLSEDVLESLYHDLVMIEIQWYAFSDGFAPDPDPDNTGTSMFVTPHMTYRLQWSAGGFEAQPIVWEDSCLSQAPEAVALRAWFKKLQKAIEATPEWQALPPITGGYE